MSSFSLLVLCIQVCLVQYAHSVRFGFPGTLGYGYGPVYGLGFGRSLGYGCGLGYGLGFGGLTGYGGIAYDEIYGGDGVGNTDVAGRMAVGGTTEVEGQVPVIGAVEFGGFVPASGTVTIIGRCTGGCGCGCGSGAYRF